MAARAPVETPQRGEIITRVTTIYIVHAGEIVILRARKRVTTFKVSTDKDSVDEKKRVTRDPYTLFAILPALTPL